MRHTQLTLAPFIDLGQKPMRKPIRQRGDVRVYDSFVTGRQQCRRLIRKILRETFDYPRDILRRRVDLEPCARECRHDIGPFSAARSRSHCLNTSTMESLLLFKRGYNRTGAQDDARLTTVTNELLKAGE